MTKIRFDSETALNVPNINDLNNVVISSTEPTTGEEVWLQKGKNLIDPAKLIVGYSLNQSGVAVEYSTYFVTNYIEISPNTEYCSSGFKNSANKNYNIKVYYDENYEMISYVDENPSTSPANAKYIRLEGYTDYSSNLQLELGSSATEYEEYIGNSIYTKIDNESYKKFYNEIDVGMHNYSVVEHRIGTWIDGKPIYRKVFNFKITSLPHRIDFSDVDTPVKMYGTIAYNVGWHNIGGNTDTDYYSLLQYDTQDKRLSLFGSKKYEGNNYDTYIVFEYTKTTD